MRSIGRHNLRRFAKKSSIGLTEGSSASLSLVPACSRSLARFFSSWWSIRKLLAFYSSPGKRGERLGETSRCFSVEKNADNEERYYVHFE